ncbi:Alpha-galactosidase mel1 [Linum perenne]
MKKICFLFLFLALCLPSFSSSSVVADRCKLPPRGWNSYDSYCWTISEQDFLKSAQVIAKYLKHHGYEYVVVDYLWYRRLVPGSYVDALGFDVIDKWGRMVPAPDRWPSANTGKGFVEVADKVHSLGLKFGIHVMRGLSRQAYDANTPILDIATGRAYEESGREWRARDIGIKERSCSWMQNGFMSVNTSLPAGRAFLKSLYHQYADWGVDFIKHDCVFGEDFNLEEIRFVSGVLKQLDRPIIYSLSPGTSVTPVMANELRGLANMYRVTADDWDSWRDVASHFDVSRDFAKAKMVPAQGLLGNSWPDLDMLPLGWLTDQGTNLGPHRQCNLTLDEQRTQMTLWSMARSPLMFGGDVRKLDMNTYKLITHPTLLEINDYSSNNMEACKVIDPTRKISHLPRRSRKSSLNRVIGLTSCKDPNVNNWSVESLDQYQEQICWRQDEESNQRPLCLYKRKSQSNEHVLYGQESRALFTSDGIDEPSCLDASPRRKSMKKPSFSACKWDANQQMWKLSSNATLRSSYSGLCAKVKQVEATNEGVISGVRSWIATGRQGEIYVALFNLNTERTLISTKLSDMAKVLPGRNLEGNKAGACKGREVWSGKHYETIEDSIEMVVDKHGCALFILNCKA